MDIVLCIAFFLFGVVFGSFFNVVGLRTPIKETFVNNRSYCPSCKHQLNWYELIPVISYLFQRGKCKHCKQKISFTYPIVELFTGLLFAVSYSSLGLEWELITALLLVSLLMILFVTDITYMLIPNKILLFFLPLFLIMRIIEPLRPWWSSLIGFVVMLFLVALIILISRGGMGAGDMKLFGLLGFVLGFEKVLLAFFLSCAAGALIGLVLILLKIIERRQPVPFGPYIIFASLVSYFYGDTLIQWYLNLL